MFGPNDEFVGEEDDYTEDGELGVDYAVGDRDVETYMQKPQVVVMNPRGSRAGKGQQRHGMFRGKAARQAAGGSKEKTLRGKPVRVQFSKEKAICVVEMADGRKLTIKE